MKKLLFTLLTLLLTLLLQAQPQQQVGAARQQAMMEQIGKAAAGIRTMECDFTQVKTMSFLNDRLTSQGRMLFSAEGKLRWEYTKPYSYTFVLNGQKVAMRSGKGSQTIDLRQSRLFQGIAQVMMNSMTGRGLGALDGFSCTMYEKDGEWIAMLTPQKKDMKRLFKSICLHFSGKKPMVTQVEMTEPGGDATVISLKNVKTNCPIDEKMFAAQ